MYKSFKDDLKNNKKKYDVIYENKLEGGLLGNLTNAVGGILSNTGGIGQIAQFAQGFLPSSQGTSVAPSNYVRYQGIPVTKNSFSQMKAYLLGQGQIFWDSEYPAHLIQISAMNQQVEWKRPFEISTNPQMFTAGVSRFDINQGSLGDCWLLAAIASLVIHKNLLMRVVPFDQTFNRGDYCGMFRFYIWYYGQWLETIIDDLLPTVNGELVYMSSNDSNEFWSALLEKAYSKIYGSYRNLIGGHTSEAMVDFTGGITETFKLRKNSSLMNSKQKIDELYYTVIQSYNNKALMSCSKEGGLEAKDTSGLVSRHAYSITAVCVANRFNYGPVNLIRLRNPWGNETEWKGPWCDGSREWQLISPQDLQRLQIIRREDGEFWMDFYDFVRNFDKLEICHTDPQSMDNVGQIQNREHITHKVWELQMLYGNWKSGLNAGGCPNNRTYLMNPQFELTVYEPDDGSYDGTGTVLIGLMQRNLRQFNRDMVAIGYSIYQKPQGFQGKIFNMTLNSLTEIASSGSFVDSREVTGRHKLYPGSYIIIPSTFKPGEESQFLLRIFSVKKTNAIAYE